MAVFQAQSLSGGMQLIASRKLNDPSFVALAENVVSKTIGTLEKRKGYSQKGNTLQSGKSITGLHSYTQLAGTSNLIATVNNSGDSATVLKRLNNDTWDTVSGTSFPANAQVDMFTFLDQCWIVGANSSNNYLPTGKLSNTTYSEESSFPRARYGFVYGERIFLLDCLISSVRYNSRVYYSSIATADISGAFTVGFSNLDTDWLDIRTSDGETLTGGVESYGRALFFKTSSIHAFDKKTLQQVASVGANSGRSIVKLDNNVMFLHYSAAKKGIYMWDGARATLVSKAVQPFIEGMNPANANTVVGGVYNDRVFYHIGEVTLDEDTAKYYNIPKTYSNVTLEYDYTSNQWFVHTLAHKKTRTAGHAGKLFFGSNNGNVYEWEDGNLDDDQEIESKVITHNIYSDDKQSRSIYQFVIPNCYNYAGVSVHLSKDGGKFENIGSLQEERQYLAIGKTKADAIQLKFRSKSKFNRFVLEGYYGESQPDAYGKIMRNKNYA